MSIFLHKILSIFGYKCPVCQDVCRRLRGHDCSKLDGENGLAAATMRGFDQQWGESDSPNAGAMLRQEIRSLIRRYGQESDITLYQAIGALRVVEHDLIDMADNATQT